jgi:hypothetical protein
MRGEAVKPLLTKALCTASVKGRRRLAPQLREARWAPPKGHGAAAYHVALGEYERCMGSEAAPFLVTELESLADSASCWKVSRILASLDWEATQGRAAAWVLLQRGDIEGCAGLGSVAVDVLVHSLRDRKELRRSVAKALEMLHWEPTPDAVGAYFLIETGASPERVAAIGAAAARPLMEQLEQRGVVRAATAGEALVLLGKHGLAALAGNLQTDAHDRPTRETVLSLMAQSMGADTFATLSGAGMFTRPQARGAGRRSQLDSPTEAALTRGLDQLAEAFMVGDGRARTSIVEMMERLHGRSGLHLAKLLISSASPVVAAAVRRHHKGGWLNDEAKVALLDNAVRLGGRHQDHARRVNYYTEGREYNDTWIQCEGRRVGWVETRRHTDYEEHTDEYVRQSCPLLPF